MTTISIDDVGKLPGIIAQLAPGEEVVITDRGEPVAHVKKAQPLNRSCQPGTAKDSILWIAPDFDAPLEDFKEYME